MSGTILKDTITATYVQTVGRYPWRNGRPLAVNRAAGAIMAGSRPLGQPLASGRRSGVQAMRIRRRLPVLLGVLAVAAALALVVFLRKHAPPEPARLLPGADAFFYVNLQWARRVGFLNDLPTVSHDPEYEKFIQETGIQFERDLEQAAFAVHYPASWTGGKAGDATEPRFSEVFVAKFHGERLSAYLRTISQSVDNYGSVDIFNIPLEGRTLRVAILGVDTVAASNHDDPEVIRGIVDRSRKLASPFGGPSFLRQYYKYVPIASLAWAIVRTDPAYARGSGEFSVWSMILPTPAVVVVSARPIRLLHLRAEAFTGSEDAARRITDQMGTFLALFHSAASVTAPQGTDADVKGFFDSLKVQQEGERAVLVATASPGFIRKLVSNPGEFAPPPPAAVPPQQQPAPKAERRARHK